MHSWTISLLTTDQERTDDLTFLFPTIFSVSTLILILNIKNIVSAYSGNIIKSTKLFKTLWFLSIPVSWIFSYCYIQEINNLYTLFLVLYYLQLILIAVLLNRKKLLNFIYCFLFVENAESFIKSFSLNIFSYFVPDIKRQILSVAADLIFQTILYFLIHILFQKYHEQMYRILHEISKSTYILILFSVISLELYTSLLFLKNEIDLRKLYILQITASLFLISLIVAVLFFIVKDISRKHLQNTSDLLEQQVKIQLEHYETFTQLNKEFHSFRHDYKNHMHCIRSLIESQNYSSVLSYMDKLTDNFDPKMIFIDSGNKIADAILTNKMHTAQNDGIAFQFEGTFFSDIFPADLCTILSNGLDNAIEACLKTNNNRWIYVKAAKQKSFQYIEISNSKSSDEVFSDTQNFTSKTDKINHGYGLYNIRKAAEHYDGKVEIADKNDTFTLTVILNLNI